MKTVPAALQAHLDTGVTTMAYCWKVTRTDNTVQGFTEHDNDLSFDSVTYLSSSGFTATQIEASLGLAIDNLNVQGAISSATINEDDLAAGRYDGAEVELYWVNFEDVAERILLSKGIIGEVKRSEIAFEAELRSQAAKLQQKVGRIYQKTCDAILGDSRCQVNLASFTSTGTVQLVSGNRTLTVTGLSNNTQDFYTLGLLTFSSGDNNGLSFEVKKHNVGSTTVLELWEQTPFDVAISDTFSVIAGCDKAAATCVSKFNNIVNFQGFPFIPGNDFISRYAIRDSSQSGESIFT